MAFWMNLVAYGRCSLLCEQPFCQYVSSLRLAERVLYELWSGMERQGRLGLIFDCEG